MEVICLESTPNAKELIFAACRQCYFDGFIGDEWKDICNNPDKYSDIDKNKLISHVINSGHTSTIEHVSFSFAIDGISRACSHQLVRHRIASYSQQSQRYAGAGSDTNFFIVPPNISKHTESFGIFTKTMEELYKIYQKLKDSGISDEDARFVLPNAWKTRIVVTMNCRSLINFFNERCCTRAQWEIRSLANLMLTICKDTLPVVFNNVGAKCKRLQYCPEKVSCGKYPVFNDLIKDNKYGSIIG